MSVTNSPSVRPPIPSHGILALGGLAVLCLILLALLVVQTAMPGAPERTVVRATSAADEMAPASATSAAAAPEPIPSARVELLEISAEAPLPEDLATVLAAVEASYAPGEAAVHPDLAPYLERIVARLNTQTDAFNVRVAAPDLELAEERAAALQSLLERSGLEAGKLVPTAEQGASALTVDSI